MEEKKESGIETLIELLNEYDTEIMKSETRPRATYKGKLSCCWYDMHEVSSDLLGYLIISKQFGFIKWLVNNDKISVHKLAKAELESGWSIENQFLDEDDRQTYYTYNTLMLLSIQSNPIRFLISILK